MTRTLRLVKRAKSIPGWFTLNGETVSLAEFVRDNGEYLLASDLREMAALPIGGEITYGGGAMPEFTLRREG